MHDFDVIVLGGGSAGTSAAAAATKAGARTAMINDGELGGLCILRGCMPTKAMLATAHAIHEVNHLDVLGARLEGRVVPDFRRIMERKQQKVLRFQRAKIMGIEAQDYEVIFGRGRFEPGGGIRVDGRLLRAASYVVATGSVPMTLPIPGIERVPVWTSDDVMRLETQPRALLVQGVGPIGLELAQFFARIGTKTLLVGRSPLLHRSDLDCGRELYLALEREPRLDLAVPGQIEELRPTDQGLIARVRSGERIREFEADAMLMAIGRRAALDDLGLEHVGLEPTTSGLDHDASMRSANPQVYIAGDATGSYQILHLANQEGTVAGRNAAGADPRLEMDYRLKMAVIFTDPPFAWVGASEAEARAAAGEIIVGCASFPETGRAITMEVEHGLWKVFADPRDGNVLGSVILGPRADDLIHIISVIMHNRMKINEICELPWYHPTLSEVMLTLGRDMAHQLHRTILPPGGDTAPPGYVDRSATGESDS
jgi:pyruvate/2-oxoglutarate dehydrogenase complex dihydrolipoamide dehydrogenase (E3) component